MRALCWLVVAAVSISSGCTRAPEGPKRGKLDGNVTLNGKPVAKGYIRFLAIDPSGTNAAAEIVGGKYSVPDGQGPTKAKYRVQFSVPSDTKKRVPNDDIPGEFMEIAPESLPAKYTTASNITLDYDPDKPQPHDFRLTTP
jgi:hypothetical protein